MASSEVKQKPHGGKLVDLMVEGAAAEAAIKRATETLQLSDRQLCDVELIINGGFSPLTGFMVRCVGLRVLAGLPRSMTDALQVPSCPARRAARTPTWA